MDVLMGVVTVTVVLLLWNFAVIHYISRFFYEFFRRRKNVPSAYVGRKVVHIMGGGVTALLVPLFYEGYYWIVALMAFLLAGYVLFRRKRMMMYWFQLEENSYEVQFAIAYGLMILIGFYLRDIWIGLIPVLFMSFGDAITGLVRAFTQRRHVKSWDGTFAMFIVCSIIALWKLGIYGIAIAALVSMIERIPGIDDNVTIPFVAATCVYLHGLF
ncbi:MAG: hypothetical protein ACE5JA_08385 [bacterium]